MPQSVAPVNIFGVPMDLGQNRRGVDMGPSAIRYAGLQPRLQSLGLQVKDSGNINVPMYKWLLDADVVVADVSTYNCNAFYELGVRHAFRPYTTIRVGNYLFVAGTLPARALTC